MKAIENNFDDLKVNELLKKHFIELRSVSPAGSTHVLDIDGLKNKTINFGVFGIMKTSLDVRSNKNFKSKSW